MTPAGGNGEGAGHDSDSGEGAEPDLPPTEAMPAPFRPYRPDAPPQPPPLIPPPASPPPPRLPFPWEQAAPPPAFPWEQPVQGAPPPEPARRPIPSVNETRPPEDGDDLDRLFGASAFREYSDDSLLATVARAPEELRPRPREKPVATAGIGRTQRTLMAVAGGLIGVLLLVLLFVLGTRSGIIPPADAAPTPAASGTKPAPTAAAGVPAKPGTHPWTALTGGECIEPYTSAWESTFTVVDCMTAHGAQMVERGVFDDAADAPWPGLDELASRVTSVCTAGTIIDYSAAQQYTDLEITASYAATAEDWSKGDRAYYCFVTRDGGQQLDTDLAAKAG